MYWCVVVDVYIVVDDVCFWFVLVVVWDWCICFDLMQVQCMCCQQCGGIFEINIVYVGDLWFGVGGDGGYVI